MMTIVMIGLGMNHQWTLTPLVKNHWGTRQFQSTLPESVYYYKGKSVFLQWRNLRDTILTKLIKLIMNNVSNWYFVVPAKVYTEGDNVSSAVCLQKVLMSHFFVDLPTV